MYLNLINFSSVILVHFGILLTPDLALTDLAILVGEPQDPSTALV